MLIGRTHSVLSNDETFQYQKNRDNIPIITLRTIKISTKPYQPIHEFKTWQVKSDIHRYDEDIKVLVRTVGENLEFGKYIPSTARYLLIIQLNL